MRYQKLIEVVSNLLVSSYCFSQHFFCLSESCVVARGEPVGAPLVVHDGFRLQMLRAIQLDDEFCGEANKINHVGTDCRLATKLPTTELFGAEELPESFFGTRGLVAERAGEVALGFVAVHNPDLPPP